ncbi:MAG TPA: 8-amino-7-oxononanoate synthase [Chitinophagaceae bacterium]|jgi:8-amino-7-oxononanoate synthase
MQEEFLSRKLQERREQNAYRQLRLPDDRVDFYSNDYLGIVSNRLLPPPGSSYASGSTGSRLLAGNYPLIEETEQELAAFHHAEAGLIFNSGYDANSGLLSCVAQRGDTILYDSLSHASIRDGVRLSFAQAFSFLHNDTEDLAKKLKMAVGNIFVVTESIFSMDGDQAPLKAIAALCEQYGAGLIVDEAHATGVVGERGEGLVQQLGLERSCFARVHTFGKAVGCHGAFIAGSERLRNYLINFSRPFIFSTALPEMAVHAIRESYRLFPGLEAARRQLQQLVQQWQQARLPYEVLISSTPIQGIIIPGNEAVKKMAARLHEQQLDVRPILYPTVPRGKERLRIILHAFNTPGQMEQLVKLLGS